jgi:hypothetical protein
MVAEQHLKCRPATQVDGRVNAEVPIWFAALAAAQCEVTRNGENRPVCFQYVAGRALYTNSSQTTECIDLLGVALQEGQTVAVYWLPGDSGYTLEVYQQQQFACA